MDRRGDEEAREFRSLNMERPEACRSPLNDVHSSPRSSRCHGNRRTTSSFCRARRDDAYFHRVPVVGEKSWQRDVSLNLSDNAGESSRSVLSSSNKTMRSLMSLPGPRVKCFTFPVPPSGKGKNPGFPFFFFEE